MRFGYQKGSWIFRFKGKKYSLSAAELICIIAGVFLFLLVELNGRNDPLKEGYISRGSYGKGGEEVVLLAEGLKEDGGKTEIAFSVEERKFTKEQVRQEMEELKERLPQMILGKNPSLSQVRQNLNLLSQDEKTGFRIRWSFDQAGVISRNGTVHGETADKGRGKAVKITAEVSDGEGNIEKITIPVVVFPPELSKEEEQKQKFLEEITQSEGKARTEAGFYLPAQYQGKTITYHRKDGGEQIWLLVLGPAAAVLLRARGVSEEKKAKKQRDQSLLFDYSEVVSKLQIFLGAGMTVRTAWERIVLDYQKIKERKKEERPAYEEMLQTYYQLRSGTAEGKAYEEFGRRCMLQPYLKLAGLLEQNRKTGTKNLRYLLQAEMTDAFEQRKNLARRQGEEAATKLLVPLFLMLGVVMVIVVVPAFLTFY